MTTILNGSTRLLGIIGDPIAQVRSPEVFTALMDQDALNAICIPIHISDKDLDDNFVKSCAAIKNMIGLVVTIPHKPRALTVATWATERAQRAGAANVLRFDTTGEIAADHLDGVGMCQAIETNSGPIRGRRTLVVGSGGVGSAIAFSLAEAGASAVDVADADQLRASLLSERLQAAGTESVPVQPSATGYEVVVNASPMGMRPGDPMPFPIETLSPETAVADVINQIAPTPLVETARARGCVVTTGPQMMYNAISSMADFFGLTTNGGWDASTIEKIYPA